MSVLFTCLELVCLALNSLTILLASASRVLVCEVTPTSLVLLIH